MAVGVIVVSVYRTVAYLLLLFDEYERQLPGQDEQHEWRSELPTQLC